MGQKGDYQRLLHKPAINGQTLIGSKTSIELGLNPDGRYLQAENYKERDVLVDKIENGTFLKSNLTEDRAYNEQKYSEFEQKMEALSHEQPIDDDADPIPIEQVDKILEDIE